MPSPPSPLLLEARRLTRAVEARVLFRDLDIALRGGETLVIRGPSGTGKTLLLRMLAWLDPPGEAELRLGGEPARALGAPIWRSRVTLVAQDVPTWPGTPRELARQVAALRAQRGRGHEDPVAVTTRWSLPTEAWDRPWSALSGGERQRIALAIALARAPDVLLLDEPTSALDPDAVAAVEADLAGRTVVWVTHDAEQAARVGDHTLELRA